MKSDLSYAFHAPFSNPKMVSTVSPRGVGHHAAPRAPDRCLAAGTYTSACGFRDGWKQTVRKDAWNRDSGGA